MKIKLLDFATANRIAAGEVIETPACVVKELMENSIDAGATHIVIEVRSGGFDFICVHDNGSGMDKEDCVMCLQRHATSKITAATDLFEVSTLGFRGEALAAISSVSKLSIVSSDGTSATRVYAEGGEILTVTHESRNIGTSIEVRSLFYNIPVRKRFQKSIHRSFIDISKVVIDACLVNTSIGFSLVKDGREEFFVPRVDKTDIIVRLKKLLDPQFVLSVQSVCYKDSMFDITGFVTTVSCYFNNKSKQYFFINSRPVFYPALSSALLQAYSHILPSGKFPGAILFINIDHKEVDVNVHPRKKEVKVSNEQVLKNAVMSAVYSALGLSVIQEPLCIDAPINTEKCDSFKPDYCTDVPSMRCSNRELLVVSSDSFLVALLGRYAILNFQSAAALFSMKSAYNYDYIVFDCFHACMSVSGLSAISFFDCQFLTNDVCVDDDRWKRLNDNIGLFCVIGFICEFSVNKIIVKAAPSCVSYENINSAIVFILDCVESSLDVFDSFCKWMKIKKSAPGCILNRHNAVFIIDYCLQRGCAGKFISKLNLSDIGKILSVR